MPRPRIRQNDGQLPKAASARVPVVGDMVHFYELGGTTGARADGPFPAVITSAKEWRLDALGAVNVVVFYDGSCGSGLRSYPSVPYNDGGAEVGQWWVWPRQRG